jgi:hypothetical protein
MKSRYGALVTGLLILSLPACTLAQDSSAMYLNRAESLYRIIWNRYRTPAYPGLFTENYPSHHNDTLTYFQGSGVKEKAVSFLWPFSGMFSATNVLLKMPAVRENYLPYLDTLVTGMESYYDSSRFPPGYQAYPVKLERSDRYYDDNGLVGMDYMEAYLNTHNPVYLHRAEAVFKFILSGWNNDLGGGVTWLEGHRDQKPACSNGTATLVALKIYAGTKNKYYLDWGLKFYNWTMQNLRDPVTGVISNDKKPDGTVNRTFWTYNTGFMLEASVMLYHFTGEKKYLAEARSLAAAAYSHFARKTESGKISMLDMPWFLVVLFRGYEALYQVDGNPQYINVIAQNVNDAWLNKDQYGLISKNWYGRHADDPAKGKWLLDESCMVEFYARLAIIAKGKKNIKKLTTND